MTREEAIRAVEVMLAYADGKDIEYRLYGPNKWTTYDGNDKNHYLSFDFSKYDYRIKKEQTYRPFKNAKECWEEMLKHQPFGWIKNEYDSYLPIMYVFNGVSVQVCNEKYTFKESFKQYTFADGTPFGIKEE